jgi:NAD(P)-dependent dehydrogenase (short-subunit alcohol dehydrogenase family)
MLFDGRVALVTGASRGVGAAVAKRLAADGSKVALLARDEPALARVAREVNGLALVADVTDAAALDRVLAQVRAALGAPSIVVQCAGVASSAPLARTDDETWRSTMELNATAPFRIARATIPDMVAAGWGRVVNIASNAALTGYAYTAAYSASKHALLGWTRAIAAEVARSGVTVNAVCPGFLDTEMTARTIANVVAKTGRTEVQARASLEELSPQRRLFEVEEVAHVVAMLCSGDARGITGQAIALDGGQTMR